jgi:hypothetical protein
MWILPKQLHALSGAPDTEAFLLDLNEQSQACEQSLLVRSKPSPARTWLLKWKRDSWTQHLSGRILKLSHVKPFEIAWTSLWQGIHANPSPQPESDLAPKTQDTCGPTLPDQLELFAPECASLRMSKDISASDSERSLENWNQLVTRRRGEYSLRVKSARLTNAKGCSSWPTAATRDYKGESGSGRQERKGNPADTLPNAVAQWPTPSCGECLDQGTNWETLARLDKGGRILRRIATLHGQAAPANPSTLGSRPESLEQSQRNWQTFAHGTHNRGETPHRQVVRALVNGEKAQTQMLTVDQVFAEEIKGTNKQEQWATPRSGKTTDENPETWALRQAKGEVATMPLTAQVKQWATPQAMDGNMTNNPRKDGGQQQLPNQAGAGKLNPRWVETLMGLPIGWVMPSCAYPVTIEQTNSDCLETESFQPQQPELL